MPLTRGGEFRSRRSAYAAALVGVLAAFGLRQWLQSSLGPGIPTYALFYPIVMLATLLGGLGPGLAATALSAGVSWVWILRPVGSAALFDAGEAVGLGLFVLVCLMIAGAAEWHRLTRRRAGELARELVVRGGQDALRESEARLREEARAALEREKTIFQAVVNGARNTHLVYLDRDFNFVRVNETYAAGCGYTPEAMVGKNHFALYPHEENLAIFTRVRDTGVSVGFRDRPFTFPDQPQRGVTYWDWTLLPVKNAGGTVEGLVFSLVETTDRKRIEDAMIEEDRRKSEFLATLSHELRNPLAPIRYALEVLAGEADAEAQAQAREVIDRQLRHLVRLVDDLLDVTRIASNKLQLRRQVVRLEGVVRQAIESALPHFERGGQRFGAGPVPGDVWLDADHDRLVQVLTNLLNNASKFTPPGGRVSLDVEASDREVALHVSDSGIGLKPEDAARVFDMFVQVANSGQAGLGIGLALVKGTVELHGGRVKVQSNGPGAGTNFTVYLPRVQAPEAAADRHAALRRAVLAASWWWTTTSTRPR